MIRMLLQQAGEAFAAQYERADVTFRVETFDHVDEMKVITGSFDTGWENSTLHE